MIHRLIVILFIWLVINPVAMADLIDLGTHGMTTSTTPYFVLVAKRFSNKQENQIIDNTVIDQAINDVNRQLEQGLEQKDGFIQFPIRSTAITPGVVTNRKIEMLIAKPFCLIGDDQRSFDWIDAYREQLIALNAFCFVINVETEQRYRLLRDHLYPINHFPMAIHELPGQLDIKHYPVLISKNSIEQ